MRPFSFCTGSTEKGTQSTHWAPKVHSEHTQSIPKCTQRVYNGHPEYIFSHSGNTFRLPAPERKKKPSTLAGEGLTEISCGTNSSFFSFFFLFRIGILSKILIRKGKKGKGEPRDKERSHLPSPSLLEVMENQRFTHTVKLTLLRSSDFSP